MPLTSEQKERLFDTLRRAGWRDRDDALSAPHGTFWLAAEPTMDDLEDLRYRMLGRLDRIRTNYSSQPEREREHAMSDLRSLIEVLDEISDDKGTDAFRTVVIPLAERLAAEGGLSLTRFPHGHASATLTGSRSNGAFATLDIRRLNAARIQLWFYWWRDIDDERYSKRRCFREVTIDAPALEDQLEDAVALMLATDVSKWDETSSLA